MGIWQKSFTRVIFQYKTYNFPNFQTFSSIGVFTLFYTNYLTDTHTHTQTDVLPVYIIVMIAAPRALHGDDKAEHFGTMPARAFWDDARQGILGRCPPGHFGMMPAWAFLDDTRPGLLGRCPPGHMGRCPPGYFWTIPARSFWDDARQGFLGRCPPGLFGTIPARAF